MGTVLNLVVVLNLAPVSTGRWIVSGYFEALWYLDTGTVLFGVDLVRVPVLQSTVESLSYL